MAGTVSAIARARGTAQRKECKVGDLFCSVSVLFTLFF